MVRAVKRLFTLLFGVTFVLALTPAASAATDPVYAYQNNDTKRWVEVYEASTASGAIVGTWRWEGGNHQKWSPSKIDGTDYYVHVNRNSGHLLTAHHECRKGAIQQPPPPQTTYLSQRWRMGVAEVQGEKVGTYFINRAGCDGDEYHDQLSQSHDDDLLYNLFLYPATRSHYDDPPGCRAGEYTYYSGCFFGVAVP